MAITRGGKSEYVGACLKTWDHFWADGMLEEYMVVWDMEQHSIKSIKVGYYGIDGVNLCNTSYDIDVSDEVKRDIIKTLRANARTAFAASIAARKQEIHKGDIVEVVRGRKVKKGARLEVFWTGRRETYRSRQYAWMNETEEVAGAYDEDGNKVWIKTEYLKNITPYKTVAPKERKKFMQDYMKRCAKDLGIYF